MEKGRSSGVRRPFGFDRTLPRRSTGWRDACTFSGGTKRRFARQSGLERAWSTSPTRRHVGPVYLTLLWCLREKRQLKEALAVAEEGLGRCYDSVLAQWASTVEEELAEAERERC